MSRYGYAVQDDIGNDFNKQETSDGGTVQGQYSVLLPDGRIQTVTYSVAPNTGFVVSDEIITTRIMKDFKVLKQNKFMNHLIDV